MQPLWKSDIFRTIFACLRGVSFVWGGCGIVVLLGFATDFVTFLYIVHSVLGIKIKVQGSASPTTWLISVVQVIHYLVGLYFMPDPATLPF